MKQYWDIIKSWLQENAPHMLADLAYGASEQEIATAEKEMAIMLPASVREFYLIHNGQLTEQEALLHEEVFLSLERVVGEWRVWTELLRSGEFIYDGVPATSEPDPGIKNDWWNERWIPLTSNGCGDGFCVDLDPAPGGQWGQVISMWHDAGWRELMSQSFENWISEYAKRLFNGYYFYEEGFGVRRKEGCESFAGG